MKRLIILAALLCSSVTNAAVVAQSLLSYKDGAKAMLTLTDENTNICRASWRYGFFEPQKSRELIPTCYQVVYGQIEVRAPDGRMYHYDPSWFYVDTGWKKFWDKSVLNN